MLHEEVTHMLIVSTVTAMLSAVSLEHVPSWCMPYDYLTEEGMTRT